MIVYRITASVVLERFTSESIILPVPLPVLPVAEPEVTADIQEKVLPATVLVKAIELAVPEQIVELEGVAVTTGIGLTVTTTVIGLPTQPAAVGVMVYVAVPADVPLAVNV